MKPFHVLAILCSVLNAALLHAQTGAIADPPAPKLGTLVGRFLYDGDPPRLGESSRFGTIDLNSPLSRDNVGRVSGVELAYREYLQMGIRPRTLDDALLVSKDRGLANVIVFVTSADITFPTTETEEAKPAVLQIKDGQFTPRVLAVAADQTLEIKNTDAVSFGFHLQMFRNESVNFLVAPRSEKRLTFSNPEKIPLPFRSDHQIWANGILLVHSNPYFAVSSPDGTFAMSGLPPGKWEFRAWHEKAGYLKHWPMGRFSFEVKAGSNVLGDVKLSPDIFNK
jgi:hypothetical protein